jgi:hypothetical protein
VELEGKMKGNEKEGAEEQKEIERQADRESEWGKKLHRKYGGFGWWPLVDFSDGFWRISVAGFG